MTKPTPEQCDSNSIIDNGERVSFATWHPQLGGYCSPAIVSFKKDRDSSCFEVSNYSNGEYPTDNPQDLHYCAAKQMIKFGITILEMQVKYQVEQRGSSRAWLVDSSALDEMIARLNALRDVT